VVALGAGNGRDEAADELARPQTRASLAALVAEEVLAGLGLLVNLLHRVCFLDILAQLGGLKT